jgi:hypothetical protein
VAADSVRYRFPPLERRGLIAGVTGTQLAVAASGCAVAFFVVRLVPGAPGAGLGLVLLVTTAAGACWNVAGRTPGGWLPVAATWLGRRTRQPVISDVTQVGTTRNGPPRACPPPALAGMVLSDVSDVDGSPPMGVLRDLKAGYLVAVLEVRGRSFSLLDPAEKHGRLDSWGSVLAALCRDGSPVHRLQWVERALPAERHGLHRYLEAAARPAAAAVEEARASYAELISSAGPVGQTHSSLVVLAVDTRKAMRAARSLGSGMVGATAVLRRELRLLQGQLRQAELSVDRVFSAAEVASALGTAFDPVAVTASSTAERGRRCRSADSVWPMASAETWASWRADGSWHATYWIAEWPRVEVGPDFLSPLLLASSGCRTASVVMAPIPPARAARQAEAARTADMADEKLRQKAGFLTTARRQRQAEGVIRRESELADGHAEFRYSGYVTVSGATPAELETCCAEMEQAARQSNLELRRLYGQQAEAFTWTLPLGRGLR